MSNDTDDTIDSGKEVAKQLASGVMTSANIIHDIAGDIEGVDFQDHMDVLTIKTDDIANGDLKGLQAMLGAQAIALDTIFSTCAIKASKAGQYNANAARGWMNVGLRAQSQCRMAVLALSEIQNPRCMIQNNKAINQQVNNSAVTNTRAREAERLPHNPAVTVDMVDSSPAVDKYAHARAHERDD